MTNSILTYNKISFLDNIKVERFDVNKRYTKPHKHNKYLEIVYFTKGMGFHYLDLKCFKLQTPVVYIIRKEQVHHWEINTTPKGYVVIIKESFLPLILDKSINSELIKLNTIQEIKLSQKDPSLNALFKSLCWEMKQNSINQKVVEGGLKAILAKLNFYADVKAPNAANLAIMFKDLLSENIKNNVSFYANRLNTTPQNLNANCKKTFNKNASDIIAEYLIKETQRLLLYTNNQVSDVAYGLGFKDVSHFTKYFKRHTGKTPSQFRKERV